jgi:hypothetical protein
MTWGASKVKEDPSDAQGELAKMKEEIGTMKPKPDSSAQIASPAADATVPPALEVAAPERKLSNSSQPPKPAPVKVSSLLILAEQFPPSMRKGKLRGGAGSQSGKMHCIPDGIIGCMRRE